MTEIPITECQALKAFYLAVHTPLGKWLQTLTPSKWEGVTVTQGHVTDLSLPFKGLKGSLPPEIGNLTYLMRLDLGYNDLSGSIPPELGNITNLEIFALHVNTLSGGIPTEFGKLINLIYLKLGNNRLSASDPALIAFLNAKEPGWDTTQTIAPTNLHAQSETPSSGLQSYIQTARVLRNKLCGCAWWTFYQVLANTANKSVQMYHITELPSGLHYFRLRTYSMDNSRAILE